MRAHRASEDAPGLRSSPGNVAINRVLAPGRRSPELEERVLDLIYRAPEFLGPAFGTKFVYFLARASSDPPSRSPRA